MSAPETEWHVDGLYAFGISTPHHVGPRVDEDGPNVLLGAWLGEPALMTNNGEGMAFYLTLEQIRALSAIAERVLVTERDGSAEPSPSGNRE